MEEKGNQINETPAGDPGHADPGKDVVVTKDDDKALRFILEHNAVGPISKEENKRLLRIIDTRLLPMMIFTLMMNFLDKNALSSSVNFGLMDDVHINGSQYSWASGSIFYLSYLVAQPFVARALQVFPLGRYVGTSVLIWGIILMCIPACHNFASLMVCRALLGFTESCVNPSLMILTSQWYKRDEQPERTAWWNMGLAIAQMIGGLLGYGIGHIAYKDWNPWKWFFILYGALTILWGFFLFFYLPSTPMEARWLSEADRVLMVERVRENKTGISNSQWKWYQFWECIRDPHTWFQFSTMVLSTVPSGGISSFGSIVIKGFGYSALNTTLLNIPLGGIEAISFLVCGRITSRWSNLRLHLSWISQVPPLIGCVLLYKLPSSASVGRLISYYIVQTHNVQYVFQMAIANANCAGYTKKTTLNAIMFVAYCAAQVAGPQVFRADEAPVYRSAFVSNFVCFALMIVFLWAFQAYFMWENWRRNKMVTVEGVEPTDAAYNEGLHDRTDWEQKRTFRYVY